MSLGHCCEPKVKKKICILLASKFSTPKKLHVYFLMLFFSLQSKAFGILLHGTHTISITDLKLSSAAE